DVLNIAFSSEKNGRTQYAVFDLNGRLIKTFEKEHFKQSHHQIIIDFLTSGTYVLIIHHNGKSYNNKFVKQ
ncbi:MAG TPA: T9SS type A sorting domain-containing protein, partial [Flavobacterium sp.]|nr:T9SS type A sorting domain-containing protein [Flavobacterium sp.]